MRAVIALCIAILFTGPVRADSLANGPYTTGCMVRGANGGQMPCAGVSSSDIPSGIALTNPAITGGSVSGASSLSATGNVSSGGMFVAAQSGTPTLTGCGTGASVSGNDSRGTITTGLSVLTCQLSFISTKATPPVCVITDNATGVAESITARSTGGFTISFSLSLLSILTVYYICLQ